MQLKKMDHTALVVRDLNRSRWFYGEVLGLEEVARPSNFTFGGCWFQGPGFQVHLIYERDTIAPAGFGDAGEAVRTGLCHHIAFEVEDLKALLTRLQAHGVQVVGGPIPRGDGAIQSWVYDPSGNLLEFFAWDSSAILPVEERPGVSASS